MTSDLREAEVELIELYTEKALKAYQSGKLAEAARCAQRILAYDPEDVNALFLKGATIGRSSRPGEMHLREAFRIWIPLVERTSGAQRADLLAAIRHAFAVMTETPVMLGFRFWSSYHSVSTVAALRDVLRELLALEDTLPETPEQAAWIVPLFRANCTTWVFDVVGADLAVPAACSAELADTFYEMLQALCALARRMPPEQSGTKLLRERTVKALKNFVTRNGSHPQWESYLRQETEELVRLSTPARPSVSQP